MRLLAAAGEMNTVRGLVQDVVFQQDRYKVIFENGLQVYVTEAPSIGAELTVPVKVECLR